MVDFYGFFARFMAISAISAPYSAVLRMLSRNAFKNKS